VALRPCRARCTWRPQPCPSTCAVGVGGSLGKVMTRVGYISRNKRSRKVLLDELLQLEVIMGARWLGGRDVPRSRWGWCTRPAAPATASWPWLVRELQAVQATALEGVVAGSLIARVSPCLRCRGAGPAGYAEGCRGARCDELSAARQSSRRSRR
jgi:hypothetical protein